MVGLWEHPQQVTRPQGPQTAKPGSAPPRMLLPKDKTQARLEPEPTAHLSETSPMSKSSSLIFWPAFATAILAGTGTSEFKSRMQETRRPLEDRARSSVPPDGHTRASQQVWGSCHVLSRVCSGLQERGWQRARNEVLRGRLGKPTPRGWTEKVTTGLYTRSELLT